VQAGAGSSEFIDRRGRSAEAEVPVDCAQRRMTGSQSNRSVLSPHRQQAYPRVPCYRCRLRADSRFHSSFRRKRESRRLGRILDSRRRGNDGTQRPIVAQRSIVTSSCYQKSRAPACQKPAPKQQALVAHFSLLALSPSPPPPRQRRVGSYASGAHFAHPRNRFRDRTSRSRPRAESPRPIARRADPALCDIA
jgi:hypothetical protein